MTTEPAARVDTRQDIIARTLNTTMAVAPETRGATLVVITEGQGDWQRSHAISLDVEAWMKSSGSACIYPNVYHVRSEKNNIGVTQTAPKKSQMVANMSSALRPEIASLVFHKGFDSPCPGVSAAEMQMKAKEQLLAFSRMKSPPGSESAVGRMRPTVWYTGKKGGKQDDLAMVLQMTVYEPRVFMETIARMGV